MSVFTLRSISSFLIAMLLFFSCSGVSAKSSTGVSEYDLKAVLLVKLIRFVYLPNFDEASKNLNICIVGDNPFGETLRKITSKPLDGITIKVREFNISSGRNSCNFVFVSPNNRPSLSSIFERFAESATLTVSDIDGFAKKGGMIELALPEKGSNSISILINRKAAEAQGIKFNAQLLRLAKSIY